MQPQNDSQGRDRKLAAAAAARDFEAIMGRKPVGQLEDLNALAELYNGARQTALLLAIVGRLDNIEEQVGMVVERMTDGSLLR